ncbi:MAG: S24 family peptidase [Victivallis sp.]
MKMIDLTLSNAIRRMRAGMKSDAALADKLGLSRMHIGRILKGKINYFEDDTWQRIEPLLKPYIKDSVTLLSKCDFVAVPLLSVAQAMEMQPATHPFGDKLAELGTNEFSYFSTAKPGDFAVLITGVSMMPWYPPGTRVLVGRDEVPRTGQRVIATLADYSEPVFKVFVDLDETRFALLSINKNEGCPPIILEKMSRDWFWVWPIKESLRNEDAIDIAMREHGIHHFWETWLQKQKESEK